MSDPLSSRLELAVEAARAAGQHTLKYFQQPRLAVEHKADDSPVTVADREAEQLLRKQIAANFPHDAILGEEFGEQPGTSGYRWILDPIDGTKSFISGVPLYGTLVGVEHSGKSQIGVIYIPASDECVYAAPGQPAWYTRGTAAPVRCQVSSKPRLADGLFCTSEVGSFAKRGARQVYDALESAAWLTRTWGDCYGYLMVATGRAELMVDPIMNVWDAAAIQPIIEAAGGIFCDWRGQPTIHAGEGIATNASILQEVLTIIAS